MKKLSITIACSLIYGVSPAQHIQGYWYNAEGDNYYRMLHALPQSNVAFYSQHGGGRLLYTQRIDANGTLCYKAEQGKPAALMFNEAATGNTVLHFRKKEFTVKNIHAERVQHNKVVRWEAAVAELSSYEMAVLKSTDGRTFKEAAVIEPYSTELTAYSWTDKDPSAGSSYQLLIRGRQNDLSYLSRTLYTDEGIAVVYPTKVSDIVHIDISTTQVPGTYKIHNLQGQTVQQGNLATTQNTININDLAAGVYLMNIYTTQGATTQKLVKE